jgi:dipeptidyl-peptidase-3
MKTFIKQSVILLLLIMSFTSCKRGKEPVAVSTADFNYFVEQFDDIRILKYKLPGFEELSLKQKEYVYYLSQATLAGRDIFWDQNFRYNLLVRKTIEAIIGNYSGDKSADDYKAFLVYAKKVFFANGIHHHYSSDKFKPGFSEGYLGTLILNTDKEKLPLVKGQSAEQLISILKPVLFDDKLFARKVEQKEGSDIVAESATNFYEGVNPILTRFRLV